MKKRNLLLAGSALIASSALFAQNQQPIPAPSPNELIQNASYGISTNSLNSNGNALKPTVNKQRLISAAFRVDTTGTMLLTDTALYAYSGTRGSSPSALTGNITVVSNYDTVYAYSMGSQLVQAVPRASAKYNASDLMTVSTNYNNDGSVAQKSWKEYYAPPFETTQKSGVLVNFNATDLSYQESEYNTSGLITADTFSQSVPSMPNAGYDWDYSTVYEYDLLKRLAHSKRTLNYYNSVYSKVTVYRQHLFPSSPTSGPYRDSIFRESVINGNTIFDTSIINYTYDPAVHLVSQAITYAEPGDVPSFRATYTYNATGKMLTQLTETYTQSQWKNETRTTYQYNNDVTTSYDYETWNSTTSAWDEIQKNVYKLNADLLADTASSYVSGVLNNVATYTYNEYKNIVEQDQYNYTSGSLSAKSLTHNYYEVYDDGTPTGINTIAQNELNATIYPNPATNMVYVSVPSFKGSGTIALSNLNGSLLQSKQMKNAKETIDFSGYPKGIYFIKVTTNAGAVVKKMVKD